MGQSPRTPRTVRFGVFEVDFWAGELRKSGLKIKLQEKPFQVLGALLERAGDIVTREELRTKLWPGDTFVDFDHSINIAINKLREALNDSAKTPRFIETLGGRGYRFIAPVEAIKPESTPSHLTFQPPAPQMPELVTSRPESLPVAEVSRTGEREIPGRKSIERVGGLQAGLGGLVLVALLAASYFLSECPTPKMPPGKIMLAVLPFENLSGDPQQEFFADGLTEETIAQLGALQPERLGVIARNTIIQFKGSKKDPKEISDELESCCSKLGMTVSRSPGPRARPTPKSMSPAAVWLPAGARTTMW